MTENDDTYVKSLSEYRKSQLSMYKINSSADKK